MSGNMSHTARAYHIFCSISHLRGFLLPFPPRRDTCSLQDPPPQAFSTSNPLIHLGRERHSESKVSCPRTQDSDPARAWTRLCHPQLKNSKINFELQKRWILSCHKCSGSWDLGGGGGGWRPLILGKKKFAEESKAGRASTPPLLFNSRSRSATEMGSSSTTKTNNGFLFLISELRI